MRRRDGAHVDLPGGWPAKPSAAGVGAEGDQGDLVHRKQVAGERVHQHAASRFLANAWKRTKELLSLFVVHLAQAVERGLANTATDLAEESVRGGARLAMRRTYPSRRSVEKAPFADAGLGPAGAWLRRVSCAE